MGDMAAQVKRMASRARCIPMAAARSLERCTPCTPRPSCHHLRTCSCLAAVVAKPLGGGASARVGPAGQAAARAGSCLMFADSRSRMMATSLLHTSS